VTPQNALHRTPLHFLILSSFPRSPAAMLQRFVQPWHCNWFGFRISLSLSREGAIFRDEIENYFSCSRLARRDRDYHLTILVLRDENEIPFCYSHVSRRDRDFRKSFLVVEREKMKLTLDENSRDREFSLCSAL
jgi:hypothetical protein